MTSGAWCGEVGGGRGEVQGGGVAEGRGLYLLTLDFPHAAGLWGELISQGQSAHNRIPH